MKRVAQPLIALLLGLGLVLIPAGPAQATPWDGLGATNDDWGTFSPGPIEHQLNQGHAFNGNYTGLWQWVLHTHNIGLDRCEIDGIFGAETRGATINWQRGMGLVGDGIVGRTAQSRADDFLVAGAGETVFYRGNFSVGFARQAGSGDYYIPLPSGAAGLYVSDHPVNYMGC